MAQNPQVVKTIFSLELLLEVPRSVYAEGKKKKKRFIRTQKHLELKGKSLCPLVGNLTLISVDVSLLFLLHYTLVLGAIAFHQPGCTSGLAICL